MLERLLKLMPAAAGTAASAAVVAVMHEPAFQLCSVCRTCPLDRQQERDGDISALAGAAGTMTLVL